MRFSTPIIALAASLPLFTTAQLGFDQTICQFLYGTDYTDACCHTVISRGVNAPCTDIEYVSNLTECSTKHFPTGWAVCIEKASNTFPHRTSRYKPSDSDLKPTSTTIRLGLKRRNATSEPLDHPSSGPLFGHGPSGIITSDMTLDDMKNAYNNYFSSNAMGGAMASAVAQKHA